MDVKQFVALGLICLSASCTSKGDAYVKSNTDDSPPDGELLYLNNCAACHGVDGKLGVSGARDLASIEIDTAAIYKILVEGKNLMPPFGYILTTEEERNAVVEQVISLRE